MTYIQDISAQSYLVLLLMLLEFMNHFLPEFSFQITDIFICFCSGIHYDIFPNNGQHIIIFASFFSHGIIDLESHMYLMKAPFWLPLLVIPTS